MIQRFSQSLSPSSVSPLYRSTYARELATSLTFPVAVSMSEGAVAGYIAKQVFDASDVQVAIISSAAMFTNLTSALWARATRGHRKVPSIAGMMAGTLACVAGIGFLPVDEVGAWLLVALVVLAHTLRVGMITVRSTIWRHNYPRSQRGRITGRLAVVVHLMLLAAPTIGSLILEWDARLFRALFVASSAIGILGVVRFAQIRLRGEKRLLKFERTPEAIPTRHGDAIAIYEIDRKQPRTGASMWTVLRRDPLFRKYMFWQFIAGVSNMMIEPVIVLIAYEEANRMGVGIFIIGLALTHGLPTLLALLTLPLWAARLDQMHIVKFRVQQSWLWTLSQLVIWIALLWHGPAWAVIAIMAFGRIILGVARGAGTLAWNLGHNDFASREMVSVYMGVHVTLTGIRGAFAPFLGVFLFSGVMAFADVPGMNALFSSLGFENFQGVGKHVFVISAILSMISFLGFLTMNSHLRRTGRTKPRDD